MKEIHVLLDFENVQPSLEDLAKLAPNFTDVWLFYGSHQLKKAQQLASAHDRVTLVPISKSGKNSLDFHLTFYLGYVAAKHPEARLVVVANDQGYDPMIIHAESLGFTVLRVGFIAEKVTTKKVVAVKSAIVPVKPAAIRKAKPAKKTVIAKKVAVTKPAASKKTVPIKKAVSAKKVVAKKAVAKKISKPSVQAPVKTANAESKLLSRIKRSLTKMADKRPSKLKSFKSLLKPLLGTEYSPAAIDAVVEELKLARIIDTDGDKISYK
jgi:hypothetical protein